MKTEEEIKKAIEALDISYAIAKLPKTFEPLEHYRCALEWVLGD